MKTLVLSLCACAVLLSAINARADDPISDYDKRAAATLYTTYGGKPRTWESITAKDVDGLTRKDKSPDGKKATYSLDFGMRDPKTGGDNRGYLRITKGETLKNAEAEKWQALPKDAATGAEVFHRMARSDAGEYMQVAVRKQVGPVILTIAQRRLATEAPAAAAKELCDRFAILLSTAKQNGILGGQIKLFRASDSLPINAGDPLPIGINDTRESTLTLRMDPTDAEGKAVDNVDYLTLRLGGTFGPLATVQYRGQTLQADKAGRFVLKDPGVSCEVGITLPPGNSDPAQVALYTQSLDADGNPKPPLDFVLGGKLK